MIIGISGKSGTGKSLLANSLSASLDGVVINFDTISHKAIEHESFKTMVKEKISTNVFDANGNINRKKLGEVVFQDKEKLTLINSHSEKIMITIIDELLKSINKKYIILEYALLPLMKYFNMCDFKILVVANEAIRHERIINRDGISEEYLALREKNSPTYISSLFDMVIENNSNDKINIEPILKQIKNKETLC